MHFSLVEPQSLSSLSLSRTCIVLLCKIMLQFHRIYYHYHLSLIHWRWRDVQFRSAGWATTIVHSQLLLIMLAIIGRHCQLYVCVFSW